ncbi:MAG TPA: OadG family protein [Acholeplasmataceae bacterium]|nr:OadG family protein [Acholeplasmataceae bacterium]
MNFLAIYNGETFNYQQFGDALLITVISMLLTFAILTILMLVVSLFRHIKDQER